MRAPTSVVKGLEVALDLDSVAAVIASDQRYLLQHRENKPQVSYPDWWSLFGGAREEGETAEDALRRELCEELQLDMPSCLHLLTCWYELAFEGRTTRKAFFAVELQSCHIGNLVLHEGQGMSWFTIGEIFAMADRIVPYDLGILALYDRMSNP